MQRPNPNSLPNSRVMLLLKHQLLFPDFELISVRHLAGPHRDGLAGRADAVVGQDVVARGVALRVVAEGPGLGEVGVAGADQVIDLAGLEVAARVLAVEGEPAEAGLLHALLEREGGAGGLRRVAGRRRGGRRVAPLQHWRARAARRARARQRGVGVQLGAVVVADQGVVGARRGRVRGLDPRQAHQVRRHVQEGGDQVPLLGIARDGVGSEVEGLGGVDAVDRLGHVRSLGLGDGRGRCQAGKCGEEEGGVDHGWSWLID
ncbi:hypothetical protein PG994_012497 [Apiospora phragmitis]|uniref:Uncharacterized protein n=1 Tax=Apiospora phragmitis TaxID=2905665 RepID=A0ABR1TW91_9PEZI